MRLSHLLERPVELDPEITALTDDSRQVQPGALFVAVPGTRDDGHAYVADALARGAAAVVCERVETCRQVHQTGRPAIQVSSAREAVAELAARFYDHPARRLRLIGFTGTFGKTTTSHVLCHLLNETGARTGVLGSLGARCAGHDDPGNGLTTPGPVELHRMLRGLADAGAETIVMEVTSHALRLGRVHGLRFSDGMLTAILAGEHTDFHGSYQDYVDAKRRILGYLAESALLAYDADNRAARLIALEADVRLLAGVTQTDRPCAARDVRLGRIRLDAEGARFDVNGQPVRSSLLGRSNVRNVGLALAFALASGVELDRLREPLTRLRPLRRRMQRLRIGDRTVLDDTAAHPLSFQMTFEVAETIPHERLVVAYVIRGRRGADINVRNAAALAELAALHEAAPVILSAALDVAGEADRPTPEEVDATRRTFARYGYPFHWHDTLAAAMREAAAVSGPSDLVVLMGAQGMNEGAGLLGEYV